MTDSGGTPSRRTGRAWSDYGLVEGALRLAHQFHGDIVRKGTTIPYEAHLWAVAALVLEHGGSDVQVAAALLHDAAEDAGGEAVVASIRTELGDAVATLVVQLSDSLVDTTHGATKAPWHERKARSIASLASAPDEALLVSACDKLHNLRCLLADHRRLGSEVWSRFNERDPAAHAWYYDALARAYEGRVPEPLLSELRRAVDELLDRLRDGEAPRVDQQMRTYDRPP